MTLHSLFRPSKRGSTIWKLCQKYCENLQGRPQKHRLTALWVKKNAMQSVLYGRRSAVQVSEGPLQRLSKGSSKLSLTVRKLHLRKYCVVQVTPATTLAEHLRESSKRGLASLEGCV